MKEDIMEVFEIVFMSFFIGLTIGIAIGFFGKKE